MNTFYCQTSERRNNTGFPADTAVNGYSNPHNTGAHNSLIYCMTRWCTTAVCLIRKLDLNSTPAAIRLRFPADGAGTDTLMLLPLEKLLFSTHGHAHI